MQINTKIAACDLLGLSMRPLTASKVEVSYESQIAYFGPLDKRSRAMGLIRKAREDFARLRSEMVHDAIAARGVRSQSVLDAMGKVPREEFLASNMREFAYEDSPLPIPGEQTISQPYIVAFMTEALNLHPADRVLEIGTGSG